jgi:hypothetical protein
VRNGEIEYGPSPTYERPKRPGSINNSQNKRRGDIVKKIKGIFNVVHIDNEQFNLTLLSKIKELQDSNQEVEVQYKPITVSGILIHTALVVGRNEYD